MSARSLKALQASIMSSGPAAAVSYTLIGAIILLGGIGYAVDEWLSAPPRDEAQGPRGEIELS